MLQNIFMEIEDILLNAKDDCQRFLDNNSD
jgi:hypothetical protein